MSNKTIEEAISLVAQTADFYPAVTIIHDMMGKVLWMSKNGLNYLGINDLEFYKLSPEDYYTTFFNPEDAKDYVPKILKLVEEDIKGSCSYFQQVRQSPQHEWKWFFSSTKILVIEKGKPLATITTSAAIDQMHHMTAKADRLLQENNFLRNQSQQFAKLSNREKEVLSHMALGHTASEIAAILFLSQLTVETHKRNIRKKLGTNSSYELNEYARAFDLI